jgi:hypothetical protein
MWVRDLLIVVGPLASPARAAATNGANVLLASTRCSPEQQHCTQWSAFALITTAACADCLSRRSDLTRAFAAIVHASDDTSIELSVKSLSGETPTPPLTAPASLLPLPHSYLLFRLPAANADGARALNATIAERLSNAAEVEQRLRLQGVLGGADCAVSSSEAPTDDTPAVFHALAAVLGSQHVMRPHLEVLPRDVGVRMQSNGSADGGVVGKSEASSSEHEQSRTVAIMILVLCTTFAVFSLMVVILYAGSFHKPSELATEQSDTDLPESVGAVKTS